MDIQAEKSDFGYIAYYAKHVYTENTPSKQTVVDDYIFYEEGEESYLLGYKGTATQLNFPAKSPTGKNYAIYQYAFYNCSGLTSVMIGSGVTSIGAQAFYGCSGLTSVMIGNGVTSIGNEAFYGCYKLTSIHIPDSVTSIGNEAFYGCSGLTSVTIGNGVTSIGYSAFFGCNNLKEVNFENPNGWKANRTSLSGLDNAETAAKYLTNTYVGDYWKREG